MSGSAAEQLSLLTKILEVALDLEIEASAGGAVFDALKVPFNEACDQQQALALHAQAELDAALAFMEETFGDGQETLLFMTKLSSDPTLIEFVNRYGSDAYFKHNKKLLFHERGLSLLQEVASATQNVAD